MVNESLMTQRQRERSRWVTCIWVSIEEYREVVRAKGFQVRQCLALMEWKDFKIKENDFFSSWVWIKKVEDGENELVGENIERSLSLRGLRSPIRSGSGSSVYSEFQPRYHPPTISLTCSPLLFLLSTHRVHPSSIRAILQSSAKRHRRRPSLPPVARRRRHHQLLIDVSRN
ncbi:F-box/LRR-repeat protein 3 [Senna tora]|uniref:F-box/LRR-repeat protein 3 n=1 Tax=Senna tora TaxID=362788 RepID=A0A834T3S3_9FABA|nr:F-box/LRR-repeat protein 3 [Senna tora]